MNSKTQQRQDRQERARAVREAERKAAQRKRTLLTTGLVALVALIAVGIGIAVSASRSDSPTGPVAVPKDGVTTGNPVALGGVRVGLPTAPVIMDAYEDFNCPICGEFEKATGQALAGQIQNGTVQVRYHMLSFIDDKNGGTYSHRTANAFAAADHYAGSNQALALHAALYANQPDEASRDGLTDSRIVELAKQAGITSPQFVTAVQDNEFKNWVTQVADDGSKAGVNGTPTLFLNEKQVQLKSLLDAKSQFDPALLVQAITDAKGAK